MTQSGISPGIGSVKNDDLIAGIQDNITGLCGRLLIIAYNVPADRADLLVNGFSLTISRNASTESFSSQITGTSASPIFSFTLFNTIPLISAL